MTTYTYTYTYTNFGNTTSPEAAHEWLINRHRMGPEKGESAITQTMVDNWYRFAKSLQQGYRVDNQCGDIPIRQVQLMGDDYPGASETKGIFHPMSAVVDAEPSIHLYLTNIQSKAKLVEYISKRLRYVIFMVYSSIGTKDESKWRIYRLHEYVHQAIKEETPDVKSWPSRFTTTCSWLYKHLLPIYMHRINIIDC